MKHARWTIGAALILGSVIISTPAMAGTIKVYPGESTIQAAIDAAEPGDTVMVFPGTYHEAAVEGPALTVNKPLKLKAKISGADRRAGVRVIVEAMPGQTDGILVSPDEGQPDIDGFSIKGFTIQGFPNNGIHLRYVQNFRIENNESVNNLENGIFPTLSANGLVKRNLAYGSDDSALWVESATNVRVIQNELHTSVTGLEVTISRDIEMTGNNVWGNSVGVGLYHPSAAGLELPTGFTSGNWIVKKNHIHDNNRANTAPPGSMAGSLPAGGGVLVLGADGILVEDNVIENNNFYGIAVLDYCTAVGGSAFDCSLSPPEVDPFPDGNSYKYNEIMNNGTAPDPGHAMAAYAADLTYIMLENGHPNWFCGSDFSSMTLSFPFGQPRMTSKC